MGMTPSLDCAWESRQLRHALMHQIAVISFLTGEIQKNLFALRLCKSV
jgi:hypothetical protein